MQNPTEILSDLPLAQRLERAEGAAGAHFVEARAKARPESGATWIEVAGAYAMFDGAESPITQTFGLGMFQIPSPEDMDALEGFFRDHGATAFHEVSPMADPAVLEILNSRGYRPIELSSVMFLPLPSATSSTNPEIHIKVACDDEKELWARTAAAGWSEFTEIDGAMMLDLMRISAAREDSPCFLAELDSEPLGTAGLAIHEGVALLAGASTVPQWRRRGAQQALLKARLDYAADIGCDLAMICTAPGSTSQKNAQRQGFRMAYTRIKWKLESSGASS